MVFYFRMATGIIVLTRGRAYRCVPCGNVENKSRAELHFYTKHVIDHEIPFACVPCDFKTGDRKKLDKHLESPNHKENVGPVVESLGTLISATPKFKEHGKDLMRLTKKDSARHWMEVSTVMDTDNDETPAREVEDIRGQLLRVEPMVLAPPQGAVICNRKPETLSTGVQTDSVAQDPTVIERMEKTMNTMNKDVIETLSQVYKYIETLRVMNVRQEMLKRLEGKLDKGEEREKEDRDRRRREERERGDRDRRVRDRRHGREKARNDDKR